MARKYMQGKQIKTVAEYEEASKSLTFFMVRNRTTHKGWIESWQYQYLKHIISKGLIYEALPIKNGETK